MVNAILGLVLVATYKVKAVGKTRGQRYNLWAELDARLAKLAK